MELFVVNRYEGDETKQPEKVQDHLSELLRKIEERKKQKTAKEEEEEDKSGIVESPTITLPEKQSGKKRKKKKTANGEDESPNKVSTNTELGSIDAGTLENPVEHGDKEISKPDENQSFMVLGAAHRKKKQTVKRVLPHWLANPEIISADLSSGPVLDELKEKLDDKFIDILRSNGVNKLFPVQASLINWMNSCKNDRKKGLWPRDTCVSAPTGSGKTMAYVLPIVEHLQHRFIREIRCLVVLPVQELALQVFKVMQTYTAPTDLRVGLISGAMPFESEQTKLVKKTANGQFISRVDIIVSTPGRLIDHIEKTEGFSLANLEFLIIDEADRSTEWLKYIPAPHRSAPPLTIKNMKSCTIPPAQKLLFSATLSQDPEKLSRLGLFQPILFTSVVISDRDEDVDLDKEVGDFVGRYTSPHELTERAVECSPEYKPVVLAKLITSQLPIEKTLVFTNSGESAHRLAILLRLLLSQNNVVVDELSTQLVPKQRSEALQKFSAGEIQVLVSSDALARGLDIAGVKLVVSYDLPKHINGYIHRVGRTGRAGIPGTAISILMPNQVGTFSRMLTTAHKAFPPIEKIESLEAYVETIGYQSHLETLKELIQSEQTKEAHQMKASKRKYVNRS